MKKFFQKLKKKISQGVSFKTRRGVVPIVGIIALSVLAAGVIGLGVWAIAEGIGTVVMKIVSAVSNVAVVILGWVIRMIIGVIVGTSQYNGFIKEEVVRTGWKIVRDVCNMFFVILFLVMAFGTIIRKEQYSYKKLLLPLILMAIFVNFSLTICGLVIDFAQVIMLTFVNAFKDVASGNIINLLGVNKLIDLKYTQVAGMEMGGRKITSLEIAAVYVLAAVFAFIAVVVLVIVALLLIMRIIALWILCILSPLAFICYIVPGLQQYAKQWQDKFIHQVIVGPVIAFFLWLAFYGTQQGMLGTVAMETGRKIAFSENEALAASGLIPVVGDPSFYAVFIFGCGMLIASLVAAKQLGVVGASLAGKGINFLQRTGTAAAKKAGKVAAAPLLKGIGKGLAQRFEAATGITLNPKEWIEGYKRAMQRRAETRRTQRIMRAMERGWTLGSPVDAISQFWSWRGAWNQIRTGFRPQAMARNLYEQSGAHRRAAEENERLARQLTESEADNLRQQQSELERRRNLAERELSSIVEVTPENMERRRSLNEEINNIDNQLNNIRTALSQPIINDADRQRYLDEAARHRREQQRLEAQAAIFQPDFTLGRLDVMAAVNKRLQELAYIDDPNQLNSILDKAIVQRDPALFSAAFMKQAMNFNENEVTDHFGFRSDWRGILDMLRVIGQRIGMDTQAQLQLAGNISELCKRTGHWEATEMAVYEDGRLRPLTEPEHIIAALTEAQKVSSRTGIRQENRLAFGYEDPYSRNFHLSPLGVLLARARAEAVTRSPHEVNPNQVLYLSRPEIAQQLLAYGYPLRAMDQLRRVRGEIADIENVAERVENFLRRWAGPIP